MHLPFFFVLSGVCYALASLWKIFFIINRICNICKMKRSSKRKRTSTTSACSCCANLTVQPTPASTPPPKHSLETAATTTSKGPSRVQTPAKRSRKRPTLLPLPNEDSADRHAPHNLQNRSCVNLPLEDSADFQDLDIHNVIPDHAPFSPAPLPAQPQASSFPASVYPPNHSRPAPFSAQTIIDDDKSDDDFQDVSQAVQYHGHNILPESQTMEVPGKKLQAEPSAEDTTYCQPCEQDDEILPAEAYCTVCKEFFCSHCANVHRKQKMTRSHFLLDKSNMPTSISGLEVEYECTVPCDIHPKESIKYFCSTHQTLICGHCSVQNHRSCHADVISDISKDFKDGQEYGDVIKTIARLFEEMDLCSSDVEKNVDVVARLCENEIFNLRRYREEVNRYFGEKEQALLKLIEKMKNMDEELLGSLKPKYTNLKSKLEEINDKLEAQGNNMIQLFIETKRVKKLLEGMQNELADIKKENIIHHYEFRKDPAIERLIASDTGIGTLKNIKTDNTTTSAESDHGTIGLAVQGDGQMKTIEAAEHTVSQANHLTVLRFTPAMDIQLKYPTDNNNSYLSSMLQLAGSRLLMTDFYNNKVKVVDMQTNSLVSQIKVLSSPWDICLLPGDRVAVTMATLGIQFLETRGQLAIDNHIKVDGDCRGIAYHEDTLIVSDRYGKVAVLNMNGHIIRKTERDGNGTELFKRPFYLIVVGEGSTAFIYVSDRSRNTITQLDMNLNIIRTFQDPALNGPRGITAVGNQLLICSYGSSTIMSLHLSTGQMTQLMGVKERIRRPMYAYYCPQQSKLVVTEQDNNSVKVYNKI